MKPTNAEARLRAEKALEKIEHAQHLLADACGDLSRLKWACPQWELVGNHYDKTKALWHKVRNSIPWEKIQLDNLGSTNETKAQ